MFYCNTQYIYSKIDIWKEKHTEYCSSLINNERIGAWTRVITIFVAVTLISSVLVISATHDELLAKKSTGKKSGNNSSDTTSSNSSFSSSSVGNNSGSASDLNIVAPVNKTHCDKKGYPSCYNLGYSDGQNAPGTSCPSGHSEAYCNGYEAASLSGNNTSDTTSSNSSSSSSSVVSGGSSDGNYDLKNTVAPVDKTHCDKKGYPSCYNLGYSDGQNAPGTSCPSGHSEAYCNGYEAASLSSPPPSFGTQNPTTKINQGAESNANINVSNSSGTHITN